MGRRRLRDKIRDYVVARLGDPGAVLVVDETGFLKKGRHSAGVQRQYTGITGQVENCQIGVFLVYATTRGHTQIDRELYLPEHGWADDTDRRQVAHVPAGTGFATKPALALQMIWCQHAAGVPFGWVAADEVYGHSGSLRRGLQELGVSYVMAVPVSEHVTLPSGKPSGNKVRVDQIAVPATAWGRYACGHGSKGRRFYDWAWVAAADPRVHVVIRRSIGKIGKSDLNGAKPATCEQLAFYLAYSPVPAALTVVIKVIGTRWTVEERFQTGKNEVGLDHYQVRTWHGWYRHATLAMLAQAFLAVTAAAALTMNTDVPADIGPSVDDPGAVDDRGNSPPRAALGKKGCYRLWTTRARPGRKVRHTGSLNSRHHDPADLQRNPPDHESNRPQPTSWRSSHQTLDNLAKTTSSTLKPMPLQNPRTARTE